MSSDQMSTSNSSPVGNSSIHRSRRAVAENHNPSGSSCQQDLDEPSPKKGIAFALLTAAAFFSQNFFLLSSIPFMARELAYMFHRAVDFLFPEK